MLAALHVVRRGLQVLMRRPSGTSAILTEIETLKDEVDAILAEDTSGLARTALAKMFYSEVEESTQHLKRGNKRLMPTYLKSLRATRTCIERNVRTAAGATPCVVN